MMFWIALLSLFTVAFAAWWFILWMDGIDG